MGVSRKIAVLWFIHYCKIGGIMKFLVVILLALCTFIQCERYVLNKPRLWNRLYFSGQNRNILPPKNHHRNHLAIRKRPPSQLINSNSPQQFQKPFQDNSRLKNDNFFRENEERKFSTSTRFVSENYDHDYDYKVDNFDPKSKDPSPFLNVYDPYNNERSKEFEQQQNEYLDDYEYNDGNTEIIDDYFDEKINIEPETDPYARPRVDKIRDRKTEYVSVIPTTVGRRFKVLNVRRPGGPRKRNPKPNIDFPKPNFDASIDRPFRNDLDKQRLLLETPHHSIYNRPDSIHAHHDEFTDQVETEFIPMKNWKGYTAPFTKMIHSHLF